jgi:hypothetical protein
MLEKTRRIAVVTFFIFFTLGNWSICLTPARAGAGDIISRLRNLNAETVRPIFGLIWRRAGLRNSWEMFAHPIAVPDDSHRWYNSRFVVDVMDAEGRHRRYRFPNLRNDDLLIRYPQLRDEDYFKSFPVFRNGLYIPFSRQMVRRLRSEVGELTFPVKVKLTLVGQKIAPPLAMPIVDEVLREKLFVYSISESERVCSERDSL